MRNGGVLEEAIFGVDWGVKMVRGCANDLDNNMCLQCTRYVCRFGRWEVV